MIKNVALVAILLSAVGAASAAERVDPPAFRGTVSAIGPALSARMTGVSWHSGCPVPISGLRLLTVRYWGFDGAAHTGRLVVNEDSTRPLVSVLRRLYEARFPIRRMRLV